VEEGLRRFSTGHPQGQGELITMVLPWFRKRGNRPRHFFGEGIPSGYVKIAIEAMAQLK